MVRGVNKTSYHEPNSLVSTLRDWGLKTTTAGCWSGDKFVPEFVFGLTDELIGFFLASMWDCDGHIGEKICFLKTISPRLATDVQTMLLRLGIYSTTYETRYFNNRRQEEITAFQVSVYDLKGFSEKVAPYLVLKQMSEHSSFQEEAKDDVSREMFFEEIGAPWNGSQRSLMEVHGLSRQHFNTLNKNRPRIAAHVVASITQTLGLPRTHRNLNVRWEEIAEISPAGEELVYDITVDDIHNFVGNNIILHNCVYQEQIMLLSQKLAGFSKGDADVLRKAMGKKQIAVLNKMKNQFIEGGTSRKHPAKVLEKVWTDWEAFAMYAFNKSHSTCYALVAYQTAYLKAHYPSEYMAAVLTHSQSNIDKITFFLEECKRMGLAVKSPDVNESGVNFSVNKKGDIRYGMGAVKGVGEAAVEVMIAERKKNGPFKDIYEFMRRVSLRVVNKRVMENLVYAGAFDSFDVPVSTPGKFNLHRAAFFQPSDKYETFTEHLIRYGSAYQEEKMMSTNSLFGDLSETVGIAEPLVPRADPWGLILRLQKEKDVVGIYLSGHPLDDFRYEWENFASPLANVDNFKGRKVNVAGFVLKAEHRISQKGTGWGKFILQDYTGSLEITMFSETYAKFKSYFEEGTSIYVEGEYKQRYNSDEMEFRVLNVRLLETVGEEKTQSVTLKIPVEKISADLIERIEKLCAAHKGKHTLRVELVDFQNKERIALTSMVKKVTVGNEFIAAMELLGVECGVN